MAKNERIKRGPAADGFWDRPALMNLSADLFFAFAAVVLGWAALHGVKRLPFYPLREVVVVSPVERVSRVQIEHAARTALGGNLLALNLDEARAAFGKLPWVRSVDLRRRWPDALELSIEEHVPAARWSRAGNAGEGRLVNTRGEVFVAISDPASDALPGFIGPEGSAGAMLEQYREFEKHLATIQRKPVALTLTARAAWQLKLDNGVTIDLGRDQPKLPLAVRVERFVNHYATAQERAGIAVAAVDMRYPNGFVLRQGGTAKGIKES